VYRLIGNEIDQIISHGDSVDRYATEGRPAVNPVVLALVSILQFLEKLPDRAAAEAVAMRLDGKYALRQEPTWTGFHYSDLCGFCKRLLEHGREWVVFERLVAYLREEMQIRIAGRFRQQHPLVNVLHGRPDRMAFHPSLERALKDGRRSPVRSRRVGFSPASRAMLAGAQSTPPDAAFAPAGP
jgi:hypothetical protein